MKRLLPALLGLLPLSAHADDALRARVLDGLSAYEDVTTGAQWQAMGEDAGAELLAIARDPAALPSRRQGATQALGWFPSEAHLAYLRGLIDDTEADAGMRRGACHALANGWGDAAVPDLVRAMGAADVQLRNQAARALGRVGTPAARDALRARLSDEPSPMVKAAIHASLGEH